MSNLPVPVKNEFNSLFGENFTVESGLAEISKKYPRDIVMDMTDDETLKKARKIRTERNGLSKAINDKRIKMSAQIKEYSDEIIERIESAYEHIIVPFEAEDKKRKEEKARLKAEYEKAVAESNEKINAIKGFVSGSRGKGSEHIAGVIESIDLISVKSFHKETVHDAISVIDEVKSDLSQMYEYALAREEIEAKQKEIKVKEDAEKEQQRIRDEEAKAKDAEIEALKAQLDAQLEVNALAELEDVIKSEEDERDYVASIVEKSETGYDAVKEFCVTHRINYQVTQDLLLVIEENFTEKGV